MKALTYSIGLAFCVAIAGVSFVSESYAQNGAQAPAAMGAKGPKDMTPKVNVPDGKVPAFDGDRSDPNSPRKELQIKKVDPKQEELKTKADLTKKKTVKLETEPCTSGNCSETSAGNSKGTKGTKICPNGQLNC
jgi:hypothetical protein